MIKFSKDALWADPRSDLHIHTTMSDGSMRPAAIVRLAAKLGLRRVAITDHETVAGCEEAAAAAAALGVEALPGAELTTIDPLTGRNAHVLCYLPADPAALQRYMDPVLADRRRAKLEMAEKIAKIYPLDIQDVLAASASSQSIYEPHLMAPLCSMGYTDRPMGDLMLTLISKKGSCFVPNLKYPGTFDALEAIRSFGGLTCLAHPSQFDSLDLLERAAAAGLLDAVELYHPRNTFRDIPRIRDIASRYSLITTGGSDFHGANAREPRPLGVQLG